MVKITASESWVKKVNIPEVTHLTEVGRAPLIDFQKWFLNKVFYRLKLFRKFKFYTCMTISGRKSVKKGQKMTKKATNLVYNAFSNFFLSWLIWNISMAIVWWKKNWRHYITLGLIFSHLVKLTYHFQIYYQQLSTTL